jgi:hypothetical protein
MGVARWLRELRGHIPCARGAGDVPIRERSPARGQEMPWEGLDERVARGWETYSRHEIDEGGIPTRKQRVSHSLSREYARTRRWGWTTTDTPRRQNDGDTNATAAKRSIYQVVTCLHLRKTRKHGEMARTVQLPSIARAYGGARQAALRRCSPAACRNAAPRVAGDAEQKERQISQPHVLEDEGRRKRRRRGARRSSAKGDSHRSPARVPIFLLLPLATTTSDLPSFGSDSASLLVVNHISHWKAA